MANPNDDLISTLKAWSQLVSVEAEVLSNLRRAYDERKVHYEVDPETQRRVLKTGGKAVDYRFTGQTSIQQGKMIAQGVGDGVWADAGHRLSPSRARAEGYSDSYREGDVAYKNFLWGANSSGYPYSSPQSILLKELDQGFCARDSDCPGLSRCQGGHCVQCITSADCGPGASCKGARCIAPFSPSTDATPANSGWEGAADAAGGTGAVIWGMPADAASEAAGSYPDLIPYTAMTQGATSTAKEISGSGSSLSGGFTAVTKVTATFEEDACNALPLPEEPSLEAYSNDPCLSCTNTQTPGSCDYDPNGDGIDQDLFDLYEDQPGDLGRQVYDDFGDQDKAASCRFDTDCGTPITIWGRNPGNPGIFTGNSFDPGCVQSKSPGTDPTGDSGLQDYAITGISVISEGSGLSDGIYKSVPLTNENANGSGATFNIAVNGGRVTQIERGSGGKGYSQLDTTAYINPSELNLARATTNANGQPNYVASTTPVADQIPLRVRITQVNDPDLRCTEGSNAIAALELTASGSCLDTTINRTFYKVPTTTGSGIGAMADVVVQGGAVQSINLYCGGQDYEVGGSVSFFPGGECSGGYAVATITEIEPNPQPWQDKFNCNLVVDYADPSSLDYGAGTGLDVSGDDQNESGNCCETTPVTADLTGNSAYGMARSKCRGQVNADAIRHVLRNRGQKYSNLTQGELNQIIQDDTHSHYVVEVRPEGGKQLRLVVEEDTYGMALRDGEYVIPETTDTPCGGWEGADCNTRQLQCGKINCSDGVCCQQEDLSCCECNANCPSGYLCVKVENGRNECWPECIENCRAHTIHCLNPDTAQYELKARVCCEAHRYLSDADFEKEGRICGCPDKWKGISVGEGKILQFKWVGGSCYDQNAGLNVLPFVPYEPYRGLESSSGQGAAFAVAIGSAKSDFPGTATALAIAGQGEGYNVGDLLTPAPGSVYQYQPGAILGLKIVSRGTGYLNYGPTWVKLKQTDTPGRVQTIYVDGQYINITPPPSQGKEAWAIVHWECENPSEFMGFCKYHRVANVYLQEPYIGEGYMVGDRLKIDGDWLYQPECKDYFGAECDDSTKSQTAVVEVTSVSTCRATPILVEVTDTNSRSYCAPPCGDTTPFTVCNNTRDLELALSSGVPPKSCSDGYQGCCCDPEEDPKNEKNGGALKTKACVAGKWNIKLTIEECLCTDPEDVRDSGCSKYCASSDRIFFVCDPWDNWYGPIGPMPKQVFVGTFRNNVQYCQCPCALGFAGGRLCRCYDCEMKPSGFFMDSDGSYDFLYMACYGFQGYDLFVPMKAENNYYSATAIADTFLKKSTLQASELEDDLKMAVPKGRHYGRIDIIADENNHYLLSIPTVGAWWGFKGHWEVAPFGGTEKDFCDLDRAKLETGQMTWRAAREKYMAGGKYVTACSVVFYGLHKSTSITDYDYWSPYGKIPYASDYCSTDP